MSPAPCFYLFLSVGFLKPFRVIAAAAKRLDGAAVGEVIVNGACARQKIKEVKKTATWRSFCVSAFRQPRAKHETDNHPLCGWVTKVIPMCYNEGLRTQSLPQRWKLPSLCERADAPLRVGRGGPTELVDEENPHSTAQAGFSSSVVLAPTRLRRAGHLPSARCGRHLPRWGRLLAVCFCEAKASGLSRWPVLLGF